MGSKNDFDFKPDGYALMVSVMMALLKGRWAAEKEKVSSKADQIEALVKPPNERESQKAPELLDRFIGYVDAQQNLSAQIWKNYVDVSLADSAASAGETESPRILHDMSKGKALEELKVATRLRYRQLQKAWIILKNIDTTNARGMHSAKMDFRRRFFDCPPPALNSRSSWSEPDRHRAGSTAWFDQLKKEFDAAVSAVSSSSAHANQRRSHSTH